MRIIVPLLNGIAMSFSIAITGGYGVGKSTLAKTFQGSGVFAFCMEGYLNKRFDIGHGGSFHKRGECLRLSQEMKSGLIDHIQEEKDAKQRVLAEIPTCIWYVDKVALLESFDYVIYVVSTLESRHLYIQRAYGLDVDQSKSLIRYCDESEECLGLASDIFLNAVPIERIQWVCAKLLRSYEALSML